MAVHIKPYVYDQCPKRWATRKDLDRHRGTHSPGPRSRFFCPDSSCRSCPEGFSRQDNLKRHIKARHGDMIPPSG